MRPVILPIDAMSWQLECSQRALAIAVDYLRGLATAHPNKSVEIRDKLFEIMEARTAGIMFTQESAIDD